MSPAVCASPLNNGTLHHAIMRCFVDTSRPPTVHDLCLHFDKPERTVREALRALANDHGCVLQPLSGEIWVSHPFSAAPTTHVVSAAGHQWWANCAWCSFGMATLIGGTGTITTTNGGLSDQLVLRFEQGRLVDDEYWVHFPVPMSRAWDNVIYTCSVMLLFRASQEIDDWCNVRGLAKGDVRPAGQVWRFAAEWYGRHLEPEWRKWTCAEARDIFRRNGLGGPIWNIPEESSRF